MREQRKKEEAPIRKRDGRESSAGGMLEIASRIILGGEQRELPYPPKNGSFWRPFTLGCLLSALACAATLALWI